MTDTTRNVVDAVIARDGLKLPVDEYERLVSVYRELLPELELLRASEYRSVEPDCVSPP
jgi:hypothetical protein